MTMQAATTVDTINLNGRINESLTLEQILGFSIDAKRSAINCLQVSSLYGYSFPAIDPKVFRPLPEKYSYDAMQAFSTVEEIDAALTEVFTGRQAHINELIEETYTLQREQGRKIFESQNELCFRGELRLTLAQMEGYITRKGQGNYFEPEKVIEGLRILDATAPRMLDTFIHKHGFKSHAWSIVDDAIFLKTNGMRKEAFEKWVSWFNEMERTQKKPMKADSFRYVSDILETGQVDFCLVLWWD